MIEIFPEINERLIKDWEILLKGNTIHNPYLTPLWYQIWRNHSGRSISPRVILSRDSQANLILLGVFFVSENPKGRGLTLMGSDDVWDYRDLVLAPGKYEAAFADLALFFKQSDWEYLEFRGISEFSPTSRHFRNSMETLGLHVSQETEEPCLYLPLPSTWEGFLQILNSKDRHELKRKIRRLEREAHCTVEWAKASTLQESMEIFFDLHRKSGAEKAGFMTPVMKAYFRDLAAKMLEEGWLQLSFLRIDGQPAASFFSFDFNHTEYVYNSGYDPEFGRLSPGIVLMARCIQRAIEQGVQNFNLLKGREEYKYHLGGREEKVYRLQVVKE